MQISWQISETCKRQSLGLIQYLLLHSSQNPDQLSACVNFFFALIQLHLARKWVQQSRSMLTAFSFLPLWEQIRPQQRVCLCQRAERGSLPCDTRHHIGLLTLSWRNRTEGEQGWRLRVTNWESHYKQTLWFLPAELQKEHFIRQNTGQPGADASISSYKN